MLTTLTRETQANDAIGTMSPRYLSPREAAVRLGYDLDYVYKLIWAGRLGAQKIDGAWQVSSSAVEARLARVQM
jgi:excisionase family DNA binding protein